MQHCIETLRVKEVINKKDGCRLGRVCDAEIDVCTGQVACLIVCRGGKWLRCGCDNDLHIPWCDVDVVGDDTILVCYNPPPPPPPCKPSPRRGFRFFQ